MARINVRSARKEYQCGQCGNTIKPGESYQWAKPRYGAKVIRCGRPCRIRPSMLTSSDKLSTLYGVQESLEDMDVSKYLDKDELATDVESLAEEAQGVADEYNDSAGNFDGGGLAEGLEEKASEVEGWADEIRDAAQQIRDIAEEDSNEDEDWHDTAAGYISDVSGSQPL